jgi:hypothetical protein
MGFDRGEGFGGEGFGGKGCEGMKKELWKYLGIRNIVASLYWA